MNEIELITKALKDAYKFVKEQEQTKETGELLINLFKAEILVKNCSIPDVVGRSEQLKAEDKDLPFADYLEKWYELPRYEKVYDRKDGKGTDTEDEVIKNYRRAFRL